MRYSNSTKNLLIHLFTIFDKILKKIFDTFDISTRFWLIFKFADFEMHLNSKNYMKIFATKKRIQYCLLN